MRRTARRMTGQAIVSSRTCSSRTGTRCWVSASRRRKARRRRGDEARGPECRRLGRLPRLDQAAVILGRSRRRRPIRRRVRATSRATRRHAGPDRPAARSRRGAAGGCHRVTRRGACDRTGEVDLHLVRGTGQRRDRGEVLTGEVGQLVDQRRKLGDRQRLHAAFRIGHRRPVARLQVLAPHPLDDRNAVSNGRRDDPGDVRGERNEVQEHARQAAGESGRGRAS